MPTPNLSDIVITDNLPAHKGTDGRRARGGGCNAALPAASPVKQRFYDPAMPYGTANAAWAAPIYNRAGTIVRPSDPNSDSGRPDCEHAEWATRVAGGSRNAPPGTV